jgi:hypothetical protein
MSFQDSGYPNHFGNGMISAVDREVAIHEVARLGDRYPAAVLACAIGAPLIEATAQEAAAPAVVIPAPRQEMGAPAVAEV